MHFKSDEEAYLELSRSNPQFLHYFNKLWFSQQLQYDCGPGGTTPSKVAYYIVRPILNIRGMGVEAKREFLTPECRDKVPPGHFWCEEFFGTHHSVDFENSNGKWEVVSCYSGQNAKKALYQFFKWTKCSDEKLFENLENTMKHPLFERIIENNINHINVEFIGTNPIEIHFRHSSDPKYDEIIPIWKSQGTENLVDFYIKKGYTWINDYDNADGFLIDPRLGFFVKSNI
jgi:hypothetical protein